MIKKAVILLISFFITCNYALADELWLQNIPVKNLNELYQTIGYTGITDKSWLMLPSRRYPPVFLKNFPEDFNELTEETERNALFLKILIPLALKLNQELLEERQPILDIKKSFAKNPDLTSKQIKLLEDKAQKYDVFTRLKDEERLRFLISELLKRIDIIPPSIMISLASIETDFGTSRIVKEGNSLYKILDWHTKSGLKPIGEKEDDSYRIRTYPDIYSSMQDFALRINSSPTFDFLRNARASTRKTASSPRILGSTFAAYSFANSELRNYAGILEYTLSYYELSVVDRSVLNPQAISSQIIKKYSKFAPKK